MTEREWLKPKSVSQLLRQQVCLRYRQARLVANACARRMLDRLPPEKAFADVVELADGLAESPEFRRNRVRVLGAMTHTIASRVEGGSNIYYSVAPVLTDLTNDALDWIPTAVVTAAEVIARVCPEPGYRAAYAAECAAQLAITHDIFGNPFRPVAFDPKWRTEHAVGIAAKMYDEREFAAMPILADALEEAGCDNHDILAHCREPGVHVRGCWVVDLVLGK